MSSAPTTKVVTLATIKAACGNCSLQQLCLPIGIDPADIDRLDAIIKRRRPLARGAHVFRMGDGFDALYAIRSGSVKTYTVDDEGIEQITGFHLTGELIGLDAIGGGRHPCAAKALETTSVCEIPFDRLEDLTIDVPALGRQLLRVLGKELRHDEQLLMMLGKKSAEERLAALLVSLSARFRERGFSATEFNLSMSRNDIGNYLGLAVETVSRLFTRLQQQGLIEVDNKRIRIRDSKGLHEMAGATTRDRPQQRA